MKYSDSIPELVSPEWQPDSKVIGYGIDSLVFHPPFLLPNERLFPEATQVRQQPSGFVGLIVTHEQYRKTIHESTAELKRLRSRYPLFCDFTVLPLSMSAKADFLFLQDEQVARLASMHHAVQRKVEYQETWKAKRLVQLIYPYAGKPLAKLCHNPQNAPDWSHFFRAMTEVARFVGALHAEGYVHGDLSPNNLLYNETTPHRFTVVDWNMLCLAEEFLNQKKGKTRVGCWSPEHFSLTSKRLKEVASDRHWVIYAEEMRIYSERLLESNLSCATELARTKIREYFAPYLATPEHPVFQTMYQELSRTQPSSIGKYHDIRYLMDTISKCVHFMFPIRSKSQEERFHAFVALSLAQNLPDRTIYLQNPDRFIQCLYLILEACQNAENEIVPQPSEVAGLTEAERNLLKLLE